MKLRKLLLFFIVLTSFHAFADEQGDNMILKDVEVLLKTNDLNSVKIYMENLGSAPTVAEAYDNLVKNLYWADKGASNLIKVGNLGIDFCFNKAETERNESLKYDLKSWAKTIAYDIGTNSWPYWGDEGIKITNEEMLKGLAASLLNLKLGIELNKPTDKIAIAYWLVGAHYLAQNQLEQSKENFTKSKELSSEINDDLSITLTDGYLAIVLIHQENNGENRGSFDSIVKKLETINSDDSNFYAQQLKTVLRLSLN